MGALRDASEGLNALAADVREALDAGSVVVLALVRDDDDTPAVAVGSIGIGQCVRIVAEAMPAVACQLLENAAAAGDTGRTTTELTFKLPRNEN